jgi:hypothetical protein
MDTLLYLDTARVGQMCPEAQRADRDFALLAGEEAGSPYFDQFLRCGFTALCPPLRRRYQGLSDWARITGLKTSFRMFVGLPRDRQVLVAARSTQLVRLATRVLCLRSHNILTTDMVWPGYLKILQSECRRLGRRLIHVPIRHALFDQHAGKQDLIEQLTAYYRQYDCNGLFLSAVTYEGVRLPVSHVVQALGKTHKPRFVVVDAAQAFNHVPLGLDRPYCDFVLAGCHKWLRAYHPLGLGFLCKPSSERLIIATCREMLARCDLDDPLLRFTTELESGKLESFSETVNLATLFTATAAAGRVWRSGRTKQAELAAQLVNANRLAERATSCGWRPLRPDMPLQTGILLLRTSQHGFAQDSPDSLRTAFRTRGISLTSYRNGVVRFSLPDRPLPPASLDRICSALRHCA